MSELTPARREDAGEQAMALMSVLAERGVVGVATTYVDTSGVTRVKAVPLARLPQAARWGIGMSPVFDAFLTDDSIVAGRFAGGPVGDLRLHPDLERLVVLDQQPGWAWAPCDRYRQDGTPHPRDARLTAQRAVEQLAAAGFTAQAAFEVEWAVGTADGERFTPAVSGPAYGFTRVIEQSDYLRTVLEALDRQGVTVEQIHPEYSSGQFELSVGPEDPVAAADTLVLVKETVRAASQRHGLRASFSPKMVAGGAGNGGHVHLSIWRNGSNVFAGGDGPFGLQPTAVSFTAGILQRLPALLAVGAPSPASYLRLIPQHWAGAYQAWGLENRETALRVVQGATGSEGNAANLEVKAFDLAANPYLVVAGLVFAGLAGLAADAPLPDPVDVDPASLSDDARAEKGIAALPATLDAAVAAFEADAALAEGFGEELAATIADVRRGETARFAGSTDEEIVDALLWVF